MLEAVLDISIIVQSSHFDKKFIIDSSDIFLSLRYNDITTLKTAENVDLVP